MATGTYAPDPDLRVTDANDNPVNGGLVWTYLAGTTTPVATYTDVGLTVANGNPIVANPDGSFVAFLTPGISYKFVYETAATPPAHGAVLRTRDNILAVPTTLVQTVNTITSAVTGTVNGWDLSLTGDTLIEWIGGAPITVNGLAGGVTGRTVTFRNMSSVAGTIANFSHLTGPAGTQFNNAITTGPTPVGVGGSITWTYDGTYWVMVGYVAGGTPPAILNEGRLTYTSGVPVTTSDVIGPTSVKFTPYLGNLCSVYSGGQWVTRTFSELSLALPAVGSTNYDVFVYDNAGTLALEFSAAWNVTTAGAGKRFASGPYATALPKQDGIYVKSTDGTAIDPTRRYLGTVATLGAGVGEDSAKLRLLYNYYNRVLRPVRVTEATASWIGVGGSYRFVNNNATNYIYVLLGVVEDPIELIATLIGTSSLAMPGTYLSTAIGLNGVGAFVAAYTLGYATVWTSVNGVARYEAQIVPSGPGQNYFTWMELSGGASVTFYASTGSPLFAVSAMFGRIWS